MTWYAVPDDSHRETWAVANAQHRTSRLTDNDRSIAYGIASEADARRIAAALNYVERLAEQGCPLRPVPTQHRTMDTGGGGVMDVEEALSYATIAELGDVKLYASAEALVTLAAEVERLTATPNLAAATTRELLEELRARGEAAGDFPGERLASRADGLLRYLPDALLDYRAVGT